MLEGELMIRCLQACRVVANRHRLAGVLLVLIFLSTLPLGGETSAEETGAIDWLRDDSSARQQAIEAKKYLLVHLTSHQPGGRDRTFFEQTTGDRRVRSRAENFICLRVLCEEWQPTELGLELTPEFLSVDHLRSSPGLVVIDFCDSSRPTYGQVVGWLPFEKPAYYAAEYESAASVATFLDLPRGSLTQRMLIYAIRVHPERTESTSGVSLPALVGAAAAHAQRQARAQRQGHQRWDQRFHEIWRLVGGKPPVEICAESWPEESLLTACLGCVHAWRQSAGHWRAVVSGHASFGYDICRGNNGIWYATGILGG
ncbi:MAG: hypothetical protein P8K78_02810 [Pirellulales bacterium]|nr:hypothetical protein [Pirellulales bacterium]